jgi:DNA-binding response OmpR family regulator
VNEPASAPLVLVADDDPDILDLVRYRLERSGYAVATATDGSEAVRLAGELTPALAVLDVMMPSLDGLEATRRLRSDPSTAGIPVILLTAKAQDADVQEGFSAGADDYIRKPFSPRELSARVQAVLGRR